MSDVASQLIGRWTTDPTDREAIKEYGSTTLVFTEGGELRYIIHAESKDQIMVLTYRIENGRLVTNQPSEPQEEQTAFDLTPDGKLILNYGGIATRYIRAS